MTEIRNIVLRPDRATFETNRRALGNLNLCGQRGARLLPNRGVIRVVNTTRSTGAMLIAIFLFATILMRKYYSLLLVMTEMKRKDGNEMTHLDNIRRRSFLIQARGEQEKNHGIGRDGRNLRLRYDWTNITSSHDLTNLIIKHQSNCSIPMSTFTYRNRFGLGSDLHVYGKALGYGIEINRRIRTVGNWTWLDQLKCKNERYAIWKSGNSRESQGSPMRCYFSTSELNCPGDLEYAIANPNFDQNNSLSKANGNLISLTDDHVSRILPSKENGGEQMLQTAVVESLFTRVTPLVVQEAERQLNLVFGDKDRVPEDLITVHIRWGDKVATYEGKKRKRMPEMKKVDISEYINAINQILAQRKKEEYSSSESTGQVQSVSENKTANIYLATEDPEAAMEFRKAIPARWNLFVDQFLVDTSDHRIDEYNGSPKMAKALNGEAGFLALGSLLVAMEANDFVLTTASNWSRLMDELRRTILDSHCGNCTSMIDLRQ